MTEQQTFRSVAQALNLSGRLEELGSGEICFYGPKIKSRFGEDEDLKEFDIASHIIELPGKHFVEHETGNRGYVFFEGDKVASDFAVGKKQYDGNGATITREYNFRDLKEAGFMWEASQ